MSVTREEVRAFIRAHRVQLSEDLLEAAGTPGAGDLRREIEMYTLLLAALDDAERWQHTQRAARFWAEEGVWVIPSSGNEGHTITDTIDAARAGGDG